MKNIDYQKEIIKILERLMNKVKKDWGSGNPFADTIIHTDKVMTYEHNDDVSKGWTGTMSNITDKPKDSNVVILVSYDGAGYDFLSCEAEYGRGMITNQLQEKLEKKFGERFNIEHCNNWAFEVFDSEVK